MLKISEEQYYYLREDYCGVCLSCWEIAYGDTEPDARNYKCEACEKKEVFGIDEALIIGKVEIKDEES